MGSLAWLSLARFGGIFSEAIFSLITYQCLFGVLVPQLICITICGIVTQGIVCCKKDFYCLR